MSLRKFRLQYQIDFRSDLNTEQNRLTVKSIKDSCLKKNEESIDKIHGHILISNENQKIFPHHVSYIYYYELCDTQTA